MALDSSHLAALARDACALDQTRRAAARSFQDTFDRSGCVLLLCFSHLDELLKHHNEEVARNSLDFLGTFRLLAWISGYKTPRVIGSIVDILAFEAAAAYSTPNASILNIRDAVRDKIFQLGSGLEAVTPFLAEWKTLRSWALNRHQVSMEIVAISRSNFAGCSKTKISDLLKGRLRSQADAERQLDALCAKLTTDISMRGDRRIVDARLTAEKFIRSVSQHAGNIIDGSEHPILQIFESLDIDLSDINDKTTLEEVGDLATFISKMRTANESMGLPWAALKLRVPARRVPSAVIQHGLRKHGQDHNEWKGSDLGDSYLACLSAYADITYFDKRTLENFIRAKRREPNFASVARGVARAAHYKDIAEQLVGT